MIFRAFTLVIFNGVSGLKITFTRPSIGSQGGLSGLLNCLKAKPLNRPYLFVRCCWSETSWRRVLETALGRVAGARQLTTPLLLRNGGLCRVGKLGRKLYYFVAYDELTCLGKSSKPG